MTGTLPPNVARISREADAAPTRTSRLVNDDDDDDSRVVEAQTRAGPDALERAEGDAFKHERSSHRDILAQRTRSPARHPDVVRLRGCRLTRHAWTFRHPKVVWLCKKSVICDGYRIRAAQNCDERRRARALARLDWRVRACSSSLLHEPIVYPPVAGARARVPRIPRSGGGSVPPTRVFVLLRLARPTAERLGLLLLQLRLLRLAHLALGLDLLFLHLLSLLLQALVARPSCRSSPRARVTPA